MNEIDDIKLNLIDAGCDEKTINEFLQCTTENEQIKLLSKHRKELIDRYHCETKRIECLDFLVRKLKKENNKI